jgi:hypothetical protein
MKVKKSEVERKRKPHIDPQVHKVIEELRAWANRLPKRVAPNGSNPVERLRDMANRLELSAQAGFEDSYGYCQDVIDPHIKSNSDGLYSISKDSLIPSVNESLDYLIEFWLANRDKPDIDLCL